MKTFCHRSFVLKLPTHSGNGGFVLAIHRARVTGG
jgi:hypothetical protein